MPIPDYQKVMLPLLNALSDGKEHSNKDIIVLLAEFFNLSQQEVDQRLPGGGNKFLNKIDWAKQYLKHAGLIEYPGRSRLYKLTK